MIADRIYLATTDSNLTFLSSAVLKIVAGEAKGINGCIRYVEAIDGQLYIPLIFDPMTGSTPVNLSTYGICQGDFINIETKIAPDEKDHLVTQGHYIYSVIEDISLRVGEDDWTKVYAYGNDNPS